MQKIYSNTLKTLTKAFEECLNKQDILEEKSIVQATGSMMDVIETMPFNEEYKEALANACIEAASLINSELCLDKTSTVHAFRINLDSELGYLLHS